MWLYFLPFIKVDLLSTVLSLTEAVGVSPVSLVSPCKLPLDFTPGFSTELYSRGTRDEDSKADCITFETTDTVMKGLANNTGTN